MATAVQDLRTNQRAAMVDLLGDAANLTATQLAALNAYIAAIDEEDEKDPDGLMSVLDSVAENAPYGLRSAHSGSDSSAN
jgi:uncharacterized protein involved in propanediol utilization